MVEHYKHQQEEEPSTKLFFDSPLGGSRTLDTITVATPNSSWTLLETMIDTDTLLAETVETMSEDTPAAASDDDDGMSFEEKRLEAVSKRLEELERDLGSGGHLASTPGAFDETDETVPLEFDDTTPGASDETTGTSDEDAAPKTIFRNPALRAALWALVLLQPAVLFVIVREAARRKPVIVVPSPRHIPAPRHVPASRHVPTPRFTSTFVPRVAPPAPEPPRIEPEPEAEPDLDLLGVADILAEGLAETLGEVERGIAAARAKLGHLVNGTSLTKRVFCSLGLGAAGLAVGVPYVPGVTDNLVIGLAGAALPFLNPKEPNKVD